MITTRSTYDQCVQAINEAVKDVQEDQPELEVSEDEIWADLAVSYLIDASRRVAEEVCAVQLGFVPGQLLDFWKRQDAEKKELARKKDLERREAKKLAKLKEEREVQRAETAAVRSARCERCFVVKTPAGNCNC